MSNGNDETNGDDGAELSATICSGVDLVTLAKVVAYIAANFHDAPDDSVVDICNEAFFDNDIPLRAQWAKLSAMSDSVIIIPNVGKSPLRC